MKKIDIIQESYRELLALEGKNLIGTLVYPKWYSYNKADITVGENLLYRVEPQGFWQSKIEVLKDNALVLNVNSKFSGYEVSRPTDPDRPYRFKLKGIFKNGYILINYKDEVVLEIVSNFSWKKMYPGYILTCADSFANAEFDRLLIMLCVHFSRTLYNAAAASATG